jgi:hypothetical protein
MIETVFNGVLIGVIATIGMDIWAAVVKHVLRLPTANWALVGRWFGHMPRGHFVHRPIAAAAPLSNELAIGWIGHYLTGVVYGLTYLWVVQVVLGRAPSLSSALVFGLLTLVAPWLIMQPAMGAGAFAARTPRPAVTRLVNLSMHTAFGISMYGAWLLVRDFL